MHAAMLNNCTSFAISIEYHGNDDNYKQLGQCHNRPGCDVAKLIAIN